MMKCMRKYLLVLFFVLKAFAKLEKKKEEAPTTPKKSDELVVLEEIRDSLKNTRA